MFAQRAPALITFSGASIPLFPSPSKACHSGNVLLQMDAKYLLVCVLGARHCHSLLGRRLKGKGVKKIQKGLHVFIPLSLRLQTPATYVVEGSATTYRSFLSNLPKYHTKVHSPLCTVQTFQKQSFGQKGEPMTFQLNEPNVKVKGCSNE